MTRNGCIIRLTYEQMLIRKTKNIQTVKEIRNGKDIQY